MDSWSWSWILIPQESANFIALCRMFGLKQTISFLKGHLWFVLISLRMLIVKSTTHGSCDGGLRGDNSAPPWREERLPSCSFRNSAWFHCSSWNFLQQKYSTGLAPKLRSLIKMRRQSLHLILSSLQIRHRGATSEPVQDNSNFE